MAASNLACQVHGVSKKKLGRCNDATKRKFVGHLLDYTPRNFLTNLKLKMTPWKRKQIDPNHQFSEGFHPKKFLGVKMTWFASPVPEPSRAWQRRHSPACHPDWCEALLGQSISPSSQVGFFRTNMAPRDTPLNIQGCQNFGWKVAYPLDNQDLQFVSGKLFSRLVDQTILGAKSKKVHEKNTADPKWPTHMAINELRK